MCPESAFQGISLKNTAIAQFPFIFLRVEIVSWSWCKLFNNKVLRKKRNGVRTSVLRDGVRGIRHFVAQKKLTMGLTLITGTQLKQTLWCETTVNLLKTVEHLKLMNCMGCKLHICGGPDMWPCFHSDQRSVGELELSSSSFEVLCFYLKGPT